MVLEVYNSPVTIAWNHIRDDAYPFHDSWKTASYSTILY